MFDVRIRNFETSFLESLIKTDGQSYSHTRSKTPPLIYTVISAALHSSMTETLLIFSLSAQISAPVDLPTILEHEAMVFTSTNNTPSTDATPPESQIRAVEGKGGGVSDDREELIVTDDSSSLNDNLHQLSIAELWHQLDIVRDEKKMLRRTIKEFEQQFEAESGRKMLKGDRKAMEDTYAMYKQKKGRLRLLDALVKKHMAY